MVSMPQETMLFPFGKSSYPIASSQEGKKEEIETGFQMIKKKLLKVDEKRNSSKEVESSPHSTFDELEQQIEVAETRCDTLKQQLGYMKMLYQGAEGMNITEVQKPKKSKQSKRQKSSPSCVSKVPSNAVIEEREEIRQPERDVLPAVKETVSVIFEDNEASVVSEITKNEHSGDGSGDTTKEETSKAADVISGILADVNASASSRITEVSDTQKKSKHHKKHMQLQSLSAKVEQYLSGVMEQQGKAWGEDLPSSPEISPSAAVTRNSMSETNFGNDRKGETQSHGKTSREEGHRSRMFTGHSAESADSLRNKKRKAKRVKREKKANPVSAYAGKFGSGADDALSLIMKARKKAGKVKKTESRKTVACKPDTNLYDLEGGGRRLKESKSKKSFEVLKEKLSSDRIIELYHNAAVKPQAVVSDVNFIKTRKRNKPHLKRDVLPETSTSFGCVEEDCAKELEDEEALRMTMVKSPPVEAECKVIPERTEVKEMKKSDWNCTKMATQEDVIAIPEKKTCPPSAVSTARGRRCGRGILPKCNFRNIPFVVGKATTPSHHLGLNIQQALSIIKMRHPVTGLPPMTIAQEFLRCSRDDVYGSQKKSARSQPVSAFLSRISSCTGQQCCPVLAQQQLPDVPEKDESNDKFRDLDMEPQQEGAWSPVVGRPRCNCFPARPSVDYQKLLAQYLEPAHTRSLHADTDMVPCKDTSQEEAKVSSEDNIMCAKYDTHLGSQLKCVLINIHNDLIRLNKKCNELQKILNNERDAVTDKEVLKELDILKKELQAKENDVMILMHLYEEVQRLKVQTKVILERLSSQNVAIPKIEKAAIQEPTTSMRLAKLLRNIQQFQEKLRQE